MADSVFQRERYDGVPREIAVWWTLHKGQPRAVCRMFTHVFGWELRLEVKKQLIESKVCKTDEEILACQEAWRLGLESKGWKK